MVGRNLAGLIIGAAIIVAAGMFAGMREQLLQWRNAGKGLARKRAAQMLLKSA